MPAVIVEVRAAEGGDHAKALAIDQVRIYLKLCARRELEAEIVEDRPGMLVLRVVGKRAIETFANESGGHRWQAPVAGRVQTSTITVAVLGEPTPTQVVLREADLDYATCRGSGAGGQHRNKTDSAVILKHLPTGLTVRCEAERSQTQNKETAREILRARIWEFEQNRADGARAADRKRQLGCGARGDKRRTIRVQDDVVNDHITGKQWRYKAYARGDWD